MVSSRTFLSSWEQEVSGQQPGSRGTARAGCRCSGVWGDSHSYEPVFRRCLSTVTARSDGAGSWGCDGGQEQQGCRWGLCSNWAGKQSCTGVSSSRFAKQGEGTGFFFFFLVERSRYLWLGHLPQTLRTSKCGTKLLGDFARVQQSHLLEEKL